MSDATGLVQILEAALFAAGKPLSASQLSALFEEHERPAKEDLQGALDEVRERCDGRGYELVEVASGFRFQVREQLSPWVSRLWQERPQKYSRALLETLALIAYRQPITRGEIEEIRGVAVSTNIIRTLHERDWIRVVGHRDVPGRPAMYATTRQFLDYFNLKSLDQLPALADIRDLETLNAELGFSEPLAEHESGDEGDEPTGEVTDAESTGGEGSEERVEDDISGQEAQNGASDADTEEQPLEDSGLEDRGLDESDVEESPAEESPVEASDSEQQDTSAESVAEPLNEEPSLDEQTFDKHSFEQHPSESTEGDAGEGDEEDAAASDEDSLNPSRSEAHEQGT